MTEFTGAILFCPVCCSTVDAEKEDQSEFDCGSCEQHWTQDLNLARINEYSIN
jgi:hypothetical protein